MRGEYDDYLPEKDSSVWIFDGRQASVRGDLEVLGLFDIRKLD